MRRCEKGSTKSESGISQALEQVGPVQRGATAEPENNRCQPTSITWRFAEPCNRRQKVGIVVGCTRFWPPQSRIGCLRGIVGADEAVEPRRRVHPPVGQYSTPSKDARIHLNMRRIRFLQSANARGADDGQTMMFQDAGRQNRITDTHEPPPT